MMSMQWTTLVVLLVVPLGSGMKCGQEPLIYVTQDYQDTYEFWIDSIISMKSNHCPRQLGSIGWLLDCFFMDTDYKDLEYHLWYICQYYGMLHPGSMRSLIQKYCFTHRYEALAAYQCTTGCPLADHINQICMRMYTPRRQVPQKTSQAQTTPKTSSTPAAAVATTTSAPPTTSATTKITSVSTTTTTVSSTPGN